MRAYTFALYNIMLNIMLFVLVAFPLFGVGMPGVVLWSNPNGTGSYQYVANTTYNFSASNSSVMVLPYDPDLMNQTNLSTYKPGGMADLNLFDGIMTIGELFWKATAFTGWLLFALGFHPYVYLALTAGQWAVYAFGLVQFLTNRGERTMG